LNAISARKFARSSALTALKGAGVFPFVGRSEWRRNRLLILCYHGISQHDEHLCTPQLYMAREVFRERMSTLRSMNAAILPLEEGLVRLRERSLPSMSVSITFDDGFSDLLHAGVPVLNEFQVHSTIYLSTYYTKHRLPVIPLVMDYILWKSGAGVLDASDFGIEAPAAIRDPAERREVVQNILAIADAKGLKTLEKDAMAREIARRLGVSYEEILQRRLFQIVAPEEATALARAGVDLQLHTHRHKTPRVRELFLKEIDENRTLIEEFSGKRPRHFCYPSGRYGEELVPWLKEAGVTSATTCVKGLATPDSDLFALPRFLDDGTIDLLRFQSFVAGIFA
jgi:peptidoglycan/xylan/chitin deacetylase (PgdA/CDA1 family)